MSSTVRNAKAELDELYAKITAANRNPYNLSVQLEKDEATVSICKAPWAWDIIFKYFIPHTGCPQSAIISGYTDNHCGTNPAL